MIRTYQGCQPNISKQAWVADNADVIGKVILEDDVSIWFQTVIRADCDDIIIQKGSNIQDGCILHTDQNHTLHIGSMVTIGHGCIIHGCEIASNTLVGMGAIIMNGASVGAHCIIGAGAVVTEHMKIPPRSLVVGCPARIVKQVSDQQIEEIKENAIHYQVLSKEYQSQDEQGGTIYE